MIEVNDLTLKYPSGKGIFDIDFKIEEGEAVGYLGPNGAGKTTTIRALMGFMRPDKGTCTISGLNCSLYPHKLQKSIGYIPGEISFPDKMNGFEFLKYMADMRGLKNFTRRDELLEILELDPSGRIRKFSKGMKQKLGIVAALMHDPEILILDEPTSGLDPLMQKRFVDLMIQEKKKGKTILLSSHMFEEVERTCNRAIMIKDGGIVAKADINTLRSSRAKGFVIEPVDTSAAMDIFKANGFEPRKSVNGYLELDIRGDETDKFIKTLSLTDILNVDIKSKALEDIFLSLYAGGEEKV